MVHAIKVALFIAFLLAGGGADAADDVASAWAALRGDGHVALIRHASAPGPAGDPAAYKLDDCATQRNLSEQGRAEARMDGTPLQPNSLTHAFTAFLAARGLKRIRFHDLRHSHATHMLAAGIHPKVASERLGHSKVGITLDLYSHVLPGMQDEAATQVNALISREIERQREAKKIR